MIKATSSAKHFILCLILFGFLTLPVIESYAFEPMIVLDDDSGQDVAFPWEALGMQNRKEARDHLEAYLSMLDAANATAGFNAAIAKAQIAILYFEDKLYSQALPYFEESTNWMEINTGIFNKNYIYTIYRYSYCLLNAGQEEKGNSFAARLSQMNLVFNNEHEIVSDLYGAESPEMARFLVDFAIFLDALEVFQDEERLLKRALAVQEKLMGKESPELRPILYRLAMFYGQKTGEKSNYDLVAARYDSLARNDDPKWSMPPVSDFSWREDIRNASTNLMNRNSIERELNSLPLDSPKRIGLLHDLAEIEVSQGDLKAALEFLGKVLILEEGEFGKDNPGLVPTIDRMAAILEKLGSHAKARTLYERSLKINQSKTSPTSPETAESYETLALFYDRIGDLEEAKHSLEQSLGIWQEQKTGRGESLIRVIILLAQLQHSTGNERIAEARFLEAVNLTKREFGENSVESAMVDNAVGLFYREIGDLQKARSYFVEAQKKTEGLADSQNLFQMALWSNLGLMHQDFNEYESALALLTRSCISARKYFGPASPNLSPYYSNLAMFYDKTGENKKMAKLLLEQAGLITELTLGEGHPEVADVLSNLAIVQSHQKKINDARDSILKAEKVIDEHLRSASSALSWKQKMLMLQKNRVYVDRVFSLEPIRKQQCSEAIWRWKDRVYEQISSEAVALHGQEDPALRRLFQDLAVRRQELANMIFQSPSLGNASMHNHLEREIDRLEVELAKSSAAFREERRRQNATVADVQDAIPADAALFEYFRYTHYTYDTANQSHDAQDRYMLLVLIKKRYRLVCLGKADVIDQAAAEFQKVVSNPTSSVDSIREKGNALAKLILFPGFGSLSEGPNALIFAPDSVLHTVAFAALPGKKPDRYLVEDYVLSYVSSGKDLLRWKSEPKNKNKGMLLVGDPDFQARGARDKSLRGIRAQSSCVDRNWIRNPSSLPGTSLEVNNIARQVKLPGRKTVLLGKKASEQNVKKYLEQSRFVHIATHGFFFSGACSTGSLAPSRGLGFSVQADGSISARQRVSDVENPLLLSGLLLAGAGKGSPVGGEDGILTAAEVVNLDLSKTELIVLSACETGLGELKNGEGVMGLRSAFVLANSKGLILSLWKVPDMETQELMTDFYENLFRQKGMSTAQSLQKCMIRSIGSSGPNRSHPSAWAAFTYAGAVEKMKEEMFNVSHWNPQRKEIPWDRWENWLDYVSFNNQTDNPNIEGGAFQGDERQFVLGRVCPDGDCEKTKNKLYYNTLSGLKTGDKVRFTIYFINNGREKGKGPAKNVRIGIDLENLSHHSKPNGIYPIGFIEAENAEYRTDPGLAQTLIVEHNNPVRIITDDVAILEADNPITLVPVKNSLYLVTQLTPPGQKRPVLHITEPTELTYQSDKPNTKEMVSKVTPVFSGNRAWLEFDKIPAGFRYSGFVFVDALVVEK